MRGCNDKVMKKNEFNTHWGGKDSFNAKIDWYAGGNNPKSGIHANEPNMRGWRLHVCIHHQLYFGITFARMIVVLIRGGSPSLCR